MNMDACLPGYVAAEATAATKVETRRRNGLKERGGGRDERKRESGRLERMGDGESRMKNAIMILKNGLGLSRERKRE